MVPRNLLIAAAFALVVAAAIAVSRGGDDPPSRAAAVVARVIDGDTLALANGDVVRLVQIDAPELHERECYARAARAELVALVPLRARVALEFDPRIHAADLDRADRFGRLLAYVVRAEANVNLELVRRGAATPWFFDGVRGRYAEELLEAARAARAERSGLWRACPRTRLAPFDPLETR